MTRDNMNWYGSTTTITNIECESDIRNHHHHSDGACYTRTHRRRSRWINREQDNVWLHSSSPRINLGWKPILGSHTRYIHPSNPYDRSVPTLANVNWWIDFITAYEWSLKLSASTHDSFHEAAPSRNQDNDHRWHPFTVKRQWQDHK